jgi:Domain of Unknown Function (DUF1080).
MLSSCLNRACVIALAFACLLPAEDPAPITPSHKIALFNGKNLDGWYTWLRENRYDDPQKVFSVEDGMIKISGEEWGGLVTKNAYRDYHLIVEWKWGGPAHGERKDKARDSGILVHSVGADGAYSKTWLESIEGAGDRGRLRRLHHGRRSQ